MKGLSPLLPPLVAFASCGGGGARPVQLVVFAAASTRDALQALAAPYERDHAGVELVLAFGSSGDLSRQILAASSADVFLSAGEAEMDEVGRAGLLVPGSRRTLLSNQLVVIEPADGPSPFTEPFSPGQLAGSGVRLLSLANVDTVPAGRYAKAWLQERGVWEAVAGRVLPGVDVRAALAAVESGGAQAGIVYRTDAARSRAVRIVHAVPLPDGPRITYPLAVLADRPHEGAARDFATFLASPAARAAFEAEGFLVQGSGGGGGR